jgi:pimeloyl-ACP methyl ester carboxylesterase
VRQIDGPVLLVGHSYGGAVITVAGTAARRNVVGLVHVAAFIPDAGETLAEIGARFPHTRLAEVLRQEHVPAGRHERNGRRAVDRARGAAAAAVSQLPLAASALLVDRSFMAERARARTIEVPGPHTVMVSESARVAERIRGAVRAAPLAYAPTR